MMSDYLIVSKKDQTKIEFLKYLDFPFILVPSKQKVI